MLDVVLSEKSKEKLVTYTNVDDVNQFSKYVLKQHLL